jgi:hypothetical protein
MVSPVALPFQKVCEICHIVGVIIFPIGNVHCNACCSKSTIQKLGFLHGSIATNDECILLTIKGKWLETIMHMTESKFLDLLHAKQVQLLISIRIHGKFQLSPTFALIGIQEDIRQFIPQRETSLKC